MSWGMPALGGMNTQFFRDLLYNSSSNAVTVDETLTLKKEDVKKLIDPLLNVPNYTVVHEASRLARNILSRSIPFPREVFSPEQVEKIKNTLWESGKDPKTHLKTPNELEWEAIPFVIEDNGRSHLNIDGDYWAANHSYSKFWGKDKFLGIIENPLGVYSPSRIIDHYSLIRFYSSSKATGYISPMDGWKTKTNEVCLKLIQNCIRDAQQFIDSEVPTKYKDIGPSDFRNACLEKFNCSYHFPPTALHATYALLKNRSPEVFKDGLNVIDTSAGHGHRMIGALTCEDIKVYAGTDPKEDLLPTFKTMYDDLTQESGNINGKEFIGGPCFVTTGVSEDPNNRIYSFKGYNLAFTSPPFFDTEKYSSENQSLDHFPGYYNWKEGFLRKTICNMRDCLVEDGYAAINLTNTNEYNLVEDLIKIMQEEGFEYVGYLASRKALGIQRYNSELNKDIKYGIDPIWIFQKKAKQGSVEEQGPFEDEYAMDIDSEFALVDNEFALLNDEYDFNFQMKDGGEI